MRLTPEILALALLGAACAENAENARAKARIWGNEKIPTEVERSAKQRIPADALDHDNALATRVINMPFAEVVARMGFVRYAGKAELLISNGPRKIRVVEDSVVEQGLHGGFRVKQNGKDGEPGREGVYHNGIFFIRNGRGKMRVQGIVKEQHLTMREEAWQPLQTFLAYFGPRAGLKKIGPVESSGRTAIAYELQLVDGPELVESKTGDRAKRPLSLSGKLVVDEQTAVVVEATLSGKLDVPGKDANSEAGTLTVTLTSTLKPIEGKEIKPGEFVPTIKRHPTDLNPLAFLKRDTRTSTVIGGQIGGSKTEKAPAQKTPEASKTAVEKPKKKPAKKKSAKKKPTGSN